MNKEFNVAFLDKKLYTDIKIPLVRGDKNAYKLIMDLEKYPDCKYVFIYAERADGETVYDSFEASGKREEYILKQGIYSVLGDVSVRVVLKDRGDSVLTASILRFNVIDGAYSDNLAEDMESLENVLLVAEKKADKAETLSGYGIKDAYTKTEIDNKFGGVYRYCGSATVNSGGKISIQHAEIGDVYNIATGGTFNVGYHVSIPFESDSILDNKYMQVRYCEDVNLFALAAADPDNLVCIAERGSGESPSIAQAVIRITQVAWLDDYGIEMYFEYLDESPNKEIDVENWEITYIEFDTVVKAGDNVVWNGRAWDILAGTVDTSNFATKDEATHAKTFDEIENGEFVSLNDVSAAEHKVSVKVSGANDTTIKVLKKNIFDFLETCKSVSGVTVENDVAKGQGWQVMTAKFTVPSSMSGKTISASCLLKSEGESTSYCYIRRYRTNAEIKSNQVSANSSDYTLVTFTTDVQEGDTISVSYGGTGGGSQTIYAKDFQIEIGDTVTDFEKYEEQSFTPNANGEIEITSVSPIMNITTDTDGAALEVSYNQDVNLYKNKVEKELAILKQAIIELGGTV